MLSRGGCLLTRSVLRQGRRTILSDAYPCEKEWNQSAKMEMLGNLDSYDCLAEVEKKLVGKGSAPGVDIDIAAHAISEADQIPQLKEILYNFRHTPEAHTVMDSTHHAVVRKCLQFDSPQLVLEMLDDPINYGLFPDNQVCNLLMDWFIKREKFSDAVRVGGYLMKQEMFDNALSAWLSLFSCARLIEDGIPSTSSHTEEEAEEDYEDDEEVVFKYPYLKNPYDDSHFDLKDIRKIAGKTLLWASRSLSSNSEALANARLLGFILMGQPDNALDSLRKMKSNGNKLSQNMIKLVSETDSPGEDSAETSDDPLVEIKEQLKAMEEEGAVSERRFSASLQQELKRDLAELEENDMKLSREAFQQWAQARNGSLQAQSEKVSLRKRLEEINGSLSEMADEGLLEFFESRDSLEALAKEGPAGPSDSATTQLSDEEFAKLLPSLKVEGRLKSPPQ